MARGRSFVSVLNQMAREEAKAQRRAESERKRQEREAVRRAKDLENRQRQAEKEERLQYLADREDEVSQMNKELDASVKALHGVLQHTLKVNDAISFSSLRLPQSFHPFSPPAELLQEIRPPSVEEMIARIRQPSLLERIIGLPRYAREVNRTKQQHRQLLAEAAQKEASRKAALAALQTQYENEKAAYMEKVRQRNQEVDELERAYRSWDREAVITYNTMVLERSQYPDSFPQEFRLAYDPEPKLLLVDYQLPTSDAVPAVQEYRYVKSKDQIEEKKRKATEVKEIYQDVVAGVCLRTLHEVFEADQAKALDVVTFNGYVHAVDPATGRDTRPYLVSVRASRERFDELDLRRVEKISCLRNLGAQVSPHPAELQAVRPVVEFDMVDKRFVGQDNVLEGIDSRQNLMDLDPFEFEHLIANLFAKMGLETKLTRSSRDGGVDVVAFDARPIVGGKVVIQAKRYKNVVGVSAVRDLYGTMMNEGANKGILVTTSHYGKDAYDFAAEKPIELIDGGGLLYLLDQAGVQAKIIIPE